jgi:heme-degrading monooxygenase HmoA
MSTPGYTFVSVSTAKPGRLDDLVELARRPSELMDGQVEGLLGRQVSVDRERNTVIVWTTFEKKSDLYEWLETDQGKEDHGEEQDMTAIIETFEMYDLEPVSGRL